MDLFRATARQVAALLKARDITPLDLVEAAAARISQTKERSMPRRSFASTGRATGPAV